STEVCAVYLERAQGRQRRKGPANLPTNFRFGTLGPLLCLCLVGARCEAAEDLGLARLFPFAADVFVSEPGLARLELPDRVLAEGRAGLADVRIVDRESREAPFAVDPGTEVGGPGRWSVPAKVLAVDREQTARDGLPGGTPEGYD